MAPFQAQASFFSQFRRVINADFRGYDESDVLAGDYTMASYAADITWM